MTAVDTPEFTRHLAKALRAHVEELTADLAGPQARHGVRQRTRPCAVAWVYYSVLVAWAQDHGLIGKRLREDGEKARAAAGATPSAWLAAATTDLAAHPATACLTDPAYSALRDGRPSDEVCGALLTWWATDAPALAYEVDAGPPTLSGWLIGDLLQALSDERRDGFALAQTPWWLADFLLDRTLVPAAAEFRDTTLRTCDPTCGTGHVLIRKVDYLWELYTTGRLHRREHARITGDTAPAVTGWIPVEPAAAIRRILDGVDGMEIDPLTAAVARLRVTVAIGDLMHRSGLIPALRLDAIPAAVRPRIAVGDSLLWGKVPPEQQRRAAPC